MKYGNIILEKKEYVYLKRLLNLNTYANNSNTQSSIQRLIEELKTAQIVDDINMPEDVIRFNSNVKVIAENGWENTLKIVVPSEKNVKEHKISVLSPIGIALFGYSENDELVWDFPGGQRKIKIVAVNQDENHKRIEVLL
ncbi:transcription elongation factor GreAB [Polaribacter vadi]|uniref:Transcription elongation factor GreAB n=1 Tax=Polaribacter vadi TaxID=1774273 RepID=A0A1B8U3M6_9FLAO|nr:GreA/GreB family elongation factor [Polaribacter vadi]AOW17637.1 transcription elongation factor GreAB [Polaribacter vadi]OBY66476.1 transcription elongation factor GreAB [Polaribacter vadi]